MLRMLISGTSLENYQVAVVNSKDKFSTLEEYNLVSPKYRELQGSIYKGRISSVTPGIDAAFVDIGVGDKHGFLPFNEVDMDLLKPGSTSAGQFLKADQELIVMLKRDAYDDKGPLLTTFLEFEGHYYMLRRERSSERQSKPGNLISRHIQKTSSREEVDQIRTFMNEFDLPQGYQLIMRTTGLDQKEQGLERDIDQLLQCHEDGQKQLDDADTPAPALLYTQKDNMRDAIRTHATQVGEICTDNDELFYELRQQIRKLAPWVESKLVQYNSEDPVSLFERYHVDSLVVSLFDRMVKLPGGGNIVLEQTEALLSVDVNSASSKHSNMDKTALVTNLEAAEEIARQLRLRDLGGQVVIDFIDMTTEADRKQVEARMHESLARDYQDRSVSLQEGEISQLFGLYEMSRKRVRPSLMQKLGTRCPECSQGWVLPDLTMPSRILDAVRVKGTSGEYRGQSIIINISARLARMLRRVYADELLALAEEYGVGIVVKSTLANDNDIQVYCKDKKPANPLEFNIKSPTPMPAKKSAGGGFWKRLFGKSAAPRARSRRHPSRTRRKKTSLWARIFGKTAKSAKPSRQRGQSRGGANRKPRQQTGSQRSRGGSRQRQRRDNEQRSDDRKPAGGSGRNSSGGGSGRKRRDDRHQGQGQDSKGRASDNRNRNGERGQRNDSRSQAPEDANRNRDTRPADDRTPRERDHTRENTRQQSTMQTPGDANRNRNTRPADDRTPRERDHTQENTRQQSTAQAPEGANRNRNTRPADDRTPRERDHTRENTRQQSTAQAPGDANRNRDIRPADDRTPRERDHTQENTRQQSTTQTPQPPQARRDGERQQQKGEREESRGERKAPAETQRTPNRQPAENPAPREHNRQSAENTADKQPASPPNPQGAQPSRASNDPRNKKS